MWHKRATLLDLHDICEFDVSPHLERLYSMVPIGECASPLMSGIFKLFSSASRIGSPTLTTMVTDIMGAKK